MCMGERHRSRVVKGKEVGRKKQREGECDRERKR